MTLIQFCKANDCAHYLERKDTQGNGDNYCEYSFNNGNLKITDYNTRVRSGQHRGELLQAYTKCPFIKELEQVQAVERI